jgi:hypothetical protein
MPHNYTTSSLGVSKDAYKSQVTRRNSQDAFRYYNKRSSSSSSSRPWLTQNSSNNKMLPPDPASYSLHQWMTNMTATACTAGTTPEPAYQNGAVPCHAVYYCVHLPTLHGCLAAQTQTNRIRVSQDPQQKNTGTFTTFCASFIREKTKSTSSTN